VTLGADNRLGFYVGETLMIDVTHQGTTSTIALAGECDLGQQERFQAAVREVLAARPECVVLDLSHLSFIDSSGIQAVVEFSKTAQRDRLHLVICPGPRQVQRVFALCGLTSQLPFVPHGETARMSRVTP
jgi:anti-anti-sigma factor